jgi:sulfofructosephosphate aldolase
MPAEVRVFADPDELGENLADEILRAYEQDGDRRFLLGCPGGRSLRSTYRALGFDREAAIVEAARELAALGPSLYKVEVPLQGRGDPKELERRCREIDAVVERPWVVLSSGVDPDDFPAAVEAACRAGASGILAGRALWRGVLGADDPALLLRLHSAPRLQRLGEIVDRHGRPWSR